jgi:hypothetical protein
MKTAAVRLIQRMLVDEGLNPGTIDGRLGANSYGAINQALPKRRVDLPDDWQGWGNPRKAVAYLQLLCKDRGIDVGDIDGFWGPQTDYAFDSLAHLVETGTLPGPWRDEAPLDVNPNSWPPQNNAALNEFYGKVGTNQVSLVLPYPHRVSWDLKTTIKSYECNARVHDSAKRVLQRVFDHYGMERIRELHLDRWGGCLNVRKMRGGTNWSMHSWGIAIDYDPDNNQLNYERDRATFAGDDYGAWWRFWEEEGWTSLGRTRNYDWMHVQAARI